PAIGRPDLAVVANADDEGVGVDAHLGAQVGREEDSALAIHLGLEGAGEDGALEEAAGGVGQGDAGGLRLEGGPTGPGGDGEATVDPAGQHGSALELRPKARWDCEPPLVVHRVPVLAGEHRPLPLTNYDRLAGTASRSSVSRVRSARPEDRSWRGEGRR